jgi:hypothetical protein
MIVREFSLRIAVIMLAIIFPMAFVFGGVLFRILRAVGWGT